VRLIY